MEDQHVPAEPVGHRAAAERFAGQLRALRASVGNPSFRKMAGRSGRISHTTLHEAAAGARFPSWETTREFVRACEADEAQWRRRWEEAQRTGEAPAAPPAGPAPGPGPAAPVAAGAAQAGGQDAGTPAAGADAAAPEPGPAVADPQPAGAAAVTDARRRRPRWLAAAVVAVVVLVTAAVAVLAVRGRPRDDAGQAAPSSGPRLPGDASQFVADITVPDGMEVKVGEEFTKVWAIANVGTVGWHNRFLARINPPGDGGGCRTPERVPIGDTLPGEQVMISVPVTAPSAPGRCWVSWKMVDEQGRPFFPSRRPVYFLVNVVA
ncbi:NBR1-Ig-like domain-containing protein [Actinoplanes teichomyceticus]|uniref:Ig-like domain-containing protein n=1 Tax=Actinoplanes teichomyceticus TaxID=1867 RepID=A0A561WBF0_ACTTI|nr:NBR1-Ig-like domain-containing protein [Actinoplanes teichomyceticus]TWG21192.1 Ig-like domain-containing protein [Actinoplanes teichomyceticus]GIF15013.1 hypothetical protein Ate01nite_50450 [Actinoplanes teichomyceticus]